MLFGMRVFYIMEKSLTLSTLILVSKYHFLVKGTRLLGEVANRTRARSIHMNREHFVVSLSKKVLQKQKDEGRDT